jgi:hypothetical protein
MQTSGLRVEDAPDPELSWKIYNNHRVGSVRLQWYIKRDFQDLKD